MTRALLKLGIVNVFIVVAYLFMNLLELNGVSDTASMIVRQVNWSPLFIEVIWSSPPGDPLTHGTYYLFNWSILLLILMTSLDLITVYGIRRAAD